MTAVAELGMKEGGRRKQTEKAESGFEGLVKALALGTGGGRTGVGPGLPGPALALSVTR